MPEILQTEIQDTVYPRVNFHYLTNTFNLVDLD